MSIKIFKPDEARRRILFSNNLRDMIRHGPISATKLADKLGVTVTTVYNYTRGKSYPDDDRIEEIAVALGCTVDDLFDDTYAPWKFGESDD